MNLQFGSLKIVEKTFTREQGAVRGQAYDGIKFRRFESNKGKKDAEEQGETFTPIVQEQFVVSNKAFTTMNLDEYALLQAEFEGKVFLLVVEDQDQVEPAAKFLRASMSKDGKVLKKGKMFSNSFLSDSLIASGVLSKDSMENQYLSITDVTKEIGAVPAQVKAAYLLDVDASVNADDDTEGQETAAAADEKEF